MKNVTIRELYRNQAAPGAIRVQGWIRTLRDSKVFGFIELNDGSFFKNLQVVLEDGRTDHFKDVIRFTEGSAVAVEGELVPTPDAKQPFELKADRVALIGSCPTDYPMQKKRHSLEYLREMAHLRPRTNTFSAVFRIRSLAAQAIHRFFSDRDFVYVHTPIITASDCEGAGEMFRVTTLDVDKPPRGTDGQVDYSKDFFGKPTSLTVSGQLNVECFCLALRNVYTFGPTFRAENSNTTRHAAEFWMIEPEIAFATLADDMQLVQDLIKYVLADVMAKAPEEYAFLSQFVDKGLLPRLEGIVNADFAHVTYTEAVDLLLKSGNAFEFTPYWGCDLQTEHERYLSEKTFGRPVFVTDYPKEIKAFYMRRNEDGKTVQAMDLLVPGIGELVGGSAREEREDILLAAMAEMKLNPEDYGWYLALRKYGGVPHAGFGLGFERLVMYITGIANIRDSIPFPRTVNNAEF